MKVMVLCALLFVSTTADIHRLAPYHLKPFGFDYHFPGLFSFGFAIKEEYHGDYAYETTGRGEVRSGSYRTLLPDGRSQVVNYKLDDNGYMSDIKYHTADEHDFNLDID